MSTQISEQIFYKNEWLSMLSRPSIPEDHPKISQLSDDDIENELILFSTACWRRYIGTWKIENKQFYLIDITGRYKIDDNLPVLTDWFTGLINIKRGFLLDRSDSVYEEEIKIEIENGIVIKTTIINNRNNSESIEEDDFIIW